ncbi:MAG: hypothetical protein K6T63_15880 [Alicyclobacillus herbarius]|uniref:NUDIX hydrolase n=1 Tax=Alicyclobacillus herbarius TaxID=122960 RepID=UPI00055650C1|nr:hypothetical protein [Alicyclobacillus herbarius]MCL6634091.1 hypothetical protein [Alicyclobacillus herbarius]
MGKLSCQPQRDKGSAPRESATLLICRDASDGVETVVLKRASTMRYLPNYLAFPGGLVEAVDQWMARCCTVGAVIGGTSEDAPYAVAALRETAEEVGLLLALDEGGSSTPQCNSTVQSGGQIPSEAPCLHDATDGGLRFQSAVKNGVKIQLQRLRLIGRWLGPHGRPPLFDTRFYLISYRGDGASELKASGESQWARWVSPREMLAHIETGKERAVPPTVAMLKALGQAKSVGNLMAHLSVWDPTLPEMKA